MAQLNLPARQVAPPKWPPSEDVPALQSSRDQPTARWPSLNAHKTLKLATKGRGFKGAKLRAMPKLVGQTEARESAKKRVRFGPELSGSLTGWPDRCSASVNMSRAASLRCGLFVRFMQAQARSDERKFARRSRERFLGAAYLSDSRTEAKMEEEEKEFVGGNCEDESAQYATSSEIDPEKGATRT